MASHLTQITANFSLAEAKSALMDRMLNVNSCFFSFFTSMVAMENPIVAITSPSCCPRPSDVGRLFRTAILHTFYSRRRPAGYRVYMHRHWDPLGPFLAYSPSCVRRIPARAKHMQAEFTSCVFIVRFPIAAEALHAMESSDYW